MISGSRQFEAVEEVGLRLEELLFPSIADVAVVAADVENETVRVEARSTASGSACPGCRNWSSRVHSSYLRFPADVPSAGLRVVLCLRVRRFICRVAVCSRQTFVEQVPGLTRRYGRWTERLRSTLAAVGLALAGRAGARMAGAFGVTVSRSTVLRLIEALPEPGLPTPRVVGVDEYATRKVIWSRPKGVHDVEYGPARRRVLRGGGGYLPPSITQNLPEEPCLFSGSSLPQRGWSRGPCSAMMTHRSPRSSAISPT